ncbi:MAG TPA: hypothetical protein VI141_09750, partial [Acidimicrobiia bacterium]
RLIMQKRTLLGVFTAVAAAMLLVGVAWASDDQSGDDSSPSSVVGTPTGDSTPITVADTVNGTPAEDNPGTTNTTVDDHGGTTGNTGDDHGGDRSGSDDSGDDDGDDHGGDRDDS